MGRLIRSTMAMAERLDSSRIDEPAMFILLRRVLILFSAFAFVIFFIEIYLAHFIWLQLFFQKMVWNFAITPVIFAPIGLVVSLIAAFRLTPRVVWIFQVLMVASLTVGTVGTYFHVMPRLEAGESLASVGLWLGDPPVLAPAAFAFPGIMGLMAVYRLKWRKTATELAKDVEKGLPASLEGAAISGGAAK